MMVEEEEEGNGECSLGHTKFEQPERHGSVGEPARTHCCGIPSLLALQFLAALFCCVHHVFQRWIEISNPLMSPLCL